MGIPRGNYTAGHGYSTPDEQQIAYEIIDEWWLTSLVKRVCGASTIALSQHPVVRWWRKIGKFYLSNISLVMYMTDLTTLVLSVYLVNDGLLLEGIIVGAIGAVSTNRMSKTDVNLTALKMANRMVEDFDRATPDVYEVLTR
jgi:hypothetical protein